MRIYMLAAAIALVPGLGRACGTGETEVFSCTTMSGKTAQVCQAPKSIRYSFGRPGAASEMIVAVPNGGFVWHSDGGSSMHTSDLNFDIRGTRYVVLAKRYRDGDVPLDAEVRIERDDDKVVNLMCRNESVRLNEREITAIKAAH